jgi:hypothetical protein
MKNKVLKIIKSKLGNAEDNLYRARESAKGQDSSKQYGQSGMTLDEIIKQFKDEYNKIKECIKWVESK